MSMMEVSLMLLAVCGAAMGFPGGRMISRNILDKNKAGQQGKKLSSAQRKQLRQLENQRDSGLLTKKEFAAKKKDLLKD